MRLDDFFITTPSASDMWGASAPSSTLNSDLLRTIMKGPVPGDDHLETALSLTRLVQREFEAYGTDSGQEISDEESGLILRTLRLALKRDGISFEPPWRDFPSFRSYWLREGASGSWQARRDLLAKWFLPVLEHLEAKEEQAFRSELATGVSPRTELGWPSVDEYIRQLRQRFHSATSVADYKDVGNRCVGVLEALSSVVYDPDVDCPPNEAPPPNDKTNIRIGAYVDRQLPGKGNEELRGLIKKASALAHKMKHSESADRTTTGICADTVILLANVLRRLQESP